MNSDVMQASPWGDSRPANADRAPVAALAGIFLLALALRLAAIAFVGPGPDIAGYFESGLTAANLAQVRGYTYNFSSIS